MDTVTLLTTAPMGGYKSYSRGPSYVIDVFLPEYQGHLYTTIPLRVDEVARLAFERYKIPVEDTKRRIHVIPQELVLEWTREGSTSGPWEMPLERLEGAHLQFDEFQHYAPRTEEVGRRKKWRQWISEIRHEGATIEFMTQDITSIDERLAKVITLRYDLVNLETQRDPFFKIRMSDWYELRSKLKGYWCPCIIQLEKTKVDGKWKPSGEQRKIRPCPEYYSAYNSFSKPHKRIEVDSEQADMADIETVLESAEVVVDTPKNKNLRQWERRSWPGLILWFMMRNSGHILFRVLIAGALIWFCFLGGAPMAFSYVKDIPAMVQKQKGGEVKKEEKVKPVEVVEKNEQQVEAEPEAVADDLPDGVLIRTDFPGEGKREYYLEDVRQAVLDRELLYIEIDSLTDELNRLKGEASAVVMIGTDYVIFADGRKYRVGDNVTSKGYYGKTIETINRDEGFVLFGDGSTAVIGRMHDDENERRGHLSSMGRFIPGQDKR